MENELMSDKKRLSIILGSGFSNEFALPTTKELSLHFLQPMNDNTLDNSISRVLKQFWGDAFGYTEDGQQPPYLEDHFTMLDLAANSGHHLGKKYPPSKLRAIRRMSIHRVFQILDIKYQDNEHAKHFLKALLDRFYVSIVTVNWDIVIEKILDYGQIDYGIDVRWLNSSPFLSAKRVPLFKMHGSTNWVYCDSCRKIHAGLHGKSALHMKAFLEAADFELFDLTRGDIESIRAQLNDTNRLCPICSNRLAGRLATFSYTKAFSISQFQTIWERAHDALRASDSWLFVGYSMPQADYEFKHLLKSAQLGRKDPNQWSCQVVLKHDQQAQEQYARFFGKSHVEIHQDGFTQWLSSNHFPIKGNKE
jgi:hypothetical protein